jgi:CRISPR type III-A-associated RAMP protein Csm4
MPSSPAIVVKLRPAGPWRLGTGARDHSGALGHSDLVYSAVTSAFSTLGWQEEWLKDTALSPAPAVRFTSLYPFLGRTLFAVPPRTHWPPQGTARVRWKSARFVPLALIEELLNDKHPREDRWEVDGLSGCLIPAGSNSPFRGATRTTAPVDRLTGASREAYSIACLEFAGNAGLWTAAVFREESARLAWADRLKSAFRLLADSGIGGRRSLGFGRAENVEFQEGPLGRLLQPGRPELAVPSGEETAWWLLSVCSPAEEDRIDWSRGQYALAVREGRVESPAGWGAAKRSVRVVEEGSVLVSAAQPVGAAPDVAPPGFAHPVFRFAFPVSLPVPWRTALPQPLVAPAPPPPPPAPEPEPEPAPAAPEPEPVVEPAPEPEPLPEEKSE